MANRHSCAIRFQNIIDVANLVVYPDGMRAVEDITFNVKKGEFFVSSDQTAQEGAQQSRL